MLKIENVPIGEIQPFNRNAKLHPKEQIAQIVQLFVLGGIVSSAQG